MITFDYTSAHLKSDELEDLRKISDINISDICLEDYPNLLLFPYSFDVYDRKFGSKMICSIDDRESRLSTNSIVGFIGYRNTTLSILSRFAKESTEDFFLHYMLQRLAKINLFSLQHTINGDSVFDFLIYFFPLYLKRAVNQGIYKQYITRKHNDSNVRGAVDINRHIRYNIPFNGNIAYTAKEHSYDNDITQLIRHTIEIIRRKQFGKEILNIDHETQQAVTQIVSATPSYESNELHNVINKNIRPIVHPYYSEYTHLQRLCMQILRYEEIKYGNQSDSVYGILIDAAWLWEEYLAIVIRDKFQHCLKEDGKRYYLFENFQQIIPDYLSFDKKIIADAKYIPLDKERSYGEEKATAIYYKTIAYMYRFCSNKAYLLYPCPEEVITPTDCRIKTEIAGVNGGTITKLGLRIPAKCTDFNEFSSLMSAREEEFLSKILM